MNVHTDLSQLDLIDQIRARQTRQVGDLLKPSVTSFVVTNKWSSQERFDAGLPPDDFDVAIEEEPLTPEQVSQAKRTLGL